MKHAKTVSAVVALLAVLQFASIASAQEGRFRFPFRKSTSEQETGVQGNGGQLAESDGPWLIMTASFAGDDGEARANNLAADLQSHNLKTYVYGHTFDHGGTYEGIGYDVIERNGEKTLIDKRMKTLSEPKVTEWAVLVGDFPTVDDGRGQQVLETIKTIFPESMAHFDPNRSDKHNVRTIREVARILTAGNSQKTFGPLKSAFMMPNPMLPEQYFAVNSVDQFIIDHNEDTDNSLLENPSPYSVRVASFRGAATFELDEMQETEKKMNLFQRNKQGLTDSKLVEATAKATLLTQELRKQGVDAYCFHDRNESYVCIGGFDFVTRRNADGTEDYNPEVVAVVNRYKAVVKDFPGVPGAVQPQSLSCLKGTGIVFDAQPVPVQVPRAQTRAASSGRLFR